MESLQALRQTAERWLYPELAHIAPHHRERALQRARDESFDSLEWAGILFALVVVTAFTRYGFKDPSLADRLVAALWNFAIAVPPLVLLAGPFLVRRMRRGLRAFMAEQNPARRG